MKKLQVEVCIGTSCYLLGAQDLIDAIEAMPDSEKEMVDLVGTTCLKSCGKGPNVRINGVTIPNVTPEHLIEILKENINLNLKE